MTERLTTLIDDYTESLSTRDLHKADFAEKFADYLLEKGVIVLPCKVGDTVYWVTAWDSYATQKDHKGIVNSIMIDGSDIYFSTPYKTLKLSEYRRNWFVDEKEQKVVVGIMQKARREAERALKGGAE